MHITVRRVPQHRLIVEVIEAYATCICCPKVSLKMVDPALHKGWGNGNTGIERIIASNQRRPIRLDTVAAVGMKRRINLLLRPIFRHTEAAGVGISANL